MNSQGTNEHHNKFQPPPPPMRIDRADADTTQQQQQHISRSAPNTQPPRRHNGSQRQQGRGSPNDSRHFGAAGSKGRGRGGFPRVGRNNNGSGHFPTGGGINLGSCGGGAASNIGNMGGRGLSFHHDSQHRGRGGRQYSPMRQFMGGRGGGGPPPPPPPPPPPQHLRMGTAAASGAAAAAAATNTGFMDQRNMYPPMQVGNNNIPRIGMPYHQPPPPPPPPPPSHHKQYPQVPFSQQQQQAQPQYNLNQSNLPMMKSSHPTFGGPPPTGQCPPPFTPTMTQSIFQPPFPQTPYPMQQHHHQQQQQPQPMQPLHPISQHGVMGPITTTTTTAISNTPTNPNDVTTSWSIHKGTNGIDFYHNSVTGESTFTRPSCLGPGPSATMADAGSTTTAGKKRSWTQHMDPATGRVFYYDGTITTWEKPQGFQEDTASVEGSDDKDQPPN
eukprot:CAMPEP_0176497420 /NCGR_PEP_ID=MMETSP0200_2-20121128/11713_1 /TAXON_ID=947934 /ORGANISM="Chaetoceros sp., Strain GSL56" /LENGTH=441 /DNA_ID=CAMNT_0017895429 /DNA_START=256 /DNA_END=1578 /DNA_ORIENTATION=+